MFYITAFQRFNILNDLIFSLNILRYEQVLLKLVAIIINLDTVYPLMENSYQKNHMKMCFVVSFLLRAQCLAIYLIKQNQQQVQSVKRCSYSQQFLGESKIVKSYCRYNVHSACTLMYQADKLQHCTLGNHCYVVKGSTPSFNRVGFRVTYLL